MTEVTLTLAARILRNRRLKEQNLEAQKVAAERHTGLVSRILGLEGAMIILEPCSRLAESMKTLNNLQFQYEELTVEANELREEQREEVRNG